jgi:hypothetical protein
LSEGLPEFVVVGHVCQDLLPDGRLSLGGSVSYAATTALRLGYRVGIVTSAGPDLELGQALPDVEIVYRRAERTTLFENIYHNGQRTQILHQRAHVLTCEDIPPDWRPAPMVYVGSIDQEIDEGIFQCFSAGSLIGVMPQGMFRRWDEAGRVYFAEWNPRPKVLQRINLLVISELDVPDPCRRAAEWARMADIVVVTHAERGATVYPAPGMCLLLRSLSVWRRRGMPRRPPLSPMLWLPSRSRGRVWLAFRGGSALRIICVQPLSAFFFSVRAPDLGFMKSCGRMGSVGGTRPAFGWPTGLG